MPPDTPAHRLPAHQWANKATHEFPYICTNNEPHDHTSGRPYPNPFTSAFAPPFDGL